MKKRPYERFDEIFNLNDKKIPNLELYFNKIYCFIVNKYHGHLSVTNKIISEISNYIDQITAYVMTGRYKRVDKVIVRPGAFFSISNDILYIDLNVHISEDAVPNNIYSTKLMIPIMDVSLQDIHFDRCTVTGAKAIASAIDKDITRKVLKNFKRC